MPSSCSNLLHVGKNPNSPPEHRTEIPNFGLSWWDRNEDHRGVRALDHQVDGPNFIDMGYTNIPSATAMEFPLHSGCSINEFNF